MNVTAYARATLGALALSVLAGCGGTTNFTISEDIEINGTGAATNSIDVSMSQIAGDAWKHRDKIKDAKITSATATIKTVHTDNTATSVAGEAAIERAGASSTFAAGTVGPPLSVGLNHPAQNLDATAKILKDALKGDGNLAVSYTATPTPAGAKTHITVTVLIDVEVEWSLF
jgi:hypothetical protein